MVWYYPIGKSNMDYEYILISNVRKEFNCYLDKFIEKSGVKKNTYAGELMERFFKAITYNTIDLKKEYNKYYKKEYDSLKFFLYNKYLLSFEDIDYIYEFLNDDETILYGELTWNVDYNLANLVGQDSEIIKKINSVLRSVDDED